MFKKKYCLFTFLFIVVAPYAFSAAIQQQQDEVTLIKNQLQEAQNVAYDDFSGALQLLKEAYASSLTLEDNSLTAEVLYTSGWIYYVKGIYSESLSHWVESFDLFRTLNDQKGIAKSLIGQGLIIQVIDRHKEALNIFEQVLSIYYKLEDPRLKAAPYIDQAISYMELKDYPNALEALDKAHAIAKEYDMSGIIHHYHNKTGEIEFQNGNYETALNHHEAVLADKNEPNDWEKSYA